MSDRKDNYSFLTTKQTVDTGETESEPCKESSYAGLYTSEMLDTFMPNCTGIKSSLMKVPVNALIYLVLDLEYGQLFNKHCSSTAGTVLVGFEVSTSVTVNRTVFWKVTPISLVDVR
jgi:hypothetical protein